MKLRRTLISGISFLFTINIHAQLFIKNSTNKPIDVAVAWYNEGGSFTGYVTKGWWSIEPGQTINPGISFTSTDDYFFFYSNGWEGDTKLLVSSDAFTIKNADKQYVKDQSTKYKWVLFKRVDVHFGKFEKKTYTLNLTSNEETPNVSGFFLFNTYEYKFGNLIVTIKLYSNGKKDYKIEYEGATPDCMVEYSADGFFSTETNELVFTKDGCVLKFVFTPEKNLKLTSTNGSPCSQFAGMNCTFYKETYKRKTK